VPGSSIPEHLQLFRQACDDMKIHLVECREQTGVDEQIAEKFKRQIEIHAKDLAAFFAPQQTATRFSKDIKDFKIADALHIFKSPETAHDCITRFYYQDLFRNEGLVLEKISQYGYSRFSQTEAAQNFGDFHKQLFTHNGPVENSDQLQSEYFSKMFKQARKEGPTPDLSIYLMMFFTEFKGEKHNAVTCIRTLFNKLELIHQTQTNDQDEAAIPEEPV